MPRSGKIKKKVIIPDFLYNSLQLARLINRVMKNGKKTVAQKQVYTAFEIIKEKTKQEPLEIFRQALESIKPSMEVRPRRVGGASYQVPYPVKGKRKESLAIRWLIFAAHKRPNSQYHTYGEKLAAEILDASQGRGGAIEKKNLVHKMAQANRAFSHFKW